MHTSNFKNSGVALLEYSLLIALIVVVSMSTINKLGVSIEKKTQQMNEDFPITQNK